MIPSLWVGPFDMGPFTAWHTVINDISFVVLDETSEGRKFTASYKSPSNDFVTYHLERASDTAIEAQVAVELAALVTVKPELEWQTNDMFEEAGIFIWNAFIADVALVVCFMKTSEPAKYTASWWRGGAGEATMLTKDYSKLLEAQLVLERTVFELPRKPTRCS